MKKLIALFTALLMTSYVSAQPCIPSGVTDQYVYFVAVDSTDFTTRETGLTTFTVYRSRNGGTSTAMTTPTINETDTTNMPGVYELLLDEDMTIDSGDDSQEMVFHITQAAMAPVDKTIQICRPKLTVGNTLTVSATGEGDADVTMINTSAGAATSLAGALALQDGQTGAFPTFGIKGSGTAQAYTAGTPSVTLAAAEAFGDNTLSGNLIWVKGTTGATYWQEANIVSSSGDIATIDSAFLVAPTGTLSYVIFGTPDGASSDLASIGGSTVAMAAMKQYFLGSAQADCEVNTLNFAGSTTTLACILTDKDGASITSATGRMTGRSILVLSGTYAFEERFISATTWDGTNSELQLTLSRALPGTLADAVTAIIR